MSTIEQVLVFQVGQEIYAARAAAIRRVGGIGERFDFMLTDSVLGRPLAPARSLVAAGGEGGDIALGVDQVLGMRAVDSGDVRPLPALARSLLGTGAVAGLVLLEGVPALLIDLLHLIREQLPAAAHDQRSSDA